MDTFGHFTEVKCLKMNDFTIVLTRNRVRKLNTFLQHNREDAGPL